MNNRSEFYETPKEHVDLINTIKDQVSNMKPFPYELAECIRDQAHASARQHCLEDVNKVLSEKGWHAENFQMYPKRNVYFDVYSNEGENNVLWFNMKEGEARIGLKKEIIVEATLSYNRGIKSIKIERHGIIDVLEVHNLVMAIISNTGYKFVQERN